MTDLYAKVVTIIRFGSGSSGSCAAAGCPNQWRYQIAFSVRPDAIEFPAYVCRDHADRISERSGVPIDGALARG